VKQNFNQLDRRRRLSEAKTFNQMDRRRTLSDTMYCHSQEDGQGNNTRYNRYYLIYLLFQEYSFFGNVDIDLFYRLYYSGKNKVSTEISY
jgi:hypothetical protein